MRPSEKQISRFVSAMIPKCKEVLSEIFKKEQKLLKENLANLEKMFRFEKISFKEISQGIYNKRLNGCGRNYTMALILGNGEVHPCNAVEYFHKPIVGNLMVESLRESWHSSKWQKVKLFGPGWCRFCPMNRHTFIKFVDDNSIPSSYFPPNP